MNEVTGNYTVYCLKYRLHFATQEDGTKELQTPYFMIIIRGKYQKERQANRL